jgi:hypothetical protein
MSFYVSFNYEGWVFFSQSSQTGAHLFIVALIYRFDSNVVGWGWIVQRQETNDVVLVTQSITGQSVL